jgi:hypothetical protein
MNVGGVAAVSDSDLKFRMPFGAVVSGPSSSGKTTWLMRFLEHHREMIEPAAKSVLYAYGEYHSHVPALENAGIATHPGLPDDETLRRMEKPLLLIMDDLMLTSSEDYLSNLFTKKSHHQNIGVMFLTQNLFDKSLKVARNNSQYIVLMRAPNAALGIRTLGSQLFPGKVPFFLDAYNKSTERPYGYLLIDMHASTDPALRLRTNIFPDQLTVAFIP